MRGEVMDRIRGRSGGSPVAAGNRFEYSDMTATDCGVTADREELDPVGRQRSPLQE